MNETREGDALTHLDGRNQPAAVDVSGKPETLRTATAEAVLRVPPAVMALLEDGGARAPKGPVFQTATLAGVMAVKQTSALIPLCHALRVDGCAVDIRPAPESRIVVTCTVKARERTGVEMEALTGASVAALTIYDMCKAVSHEMVIESTRLIEKTGGKRDYRAGDTI